MDAPMNLDTGANRLFVASLLLGKADSGVHQCGNDGETLHYEWMICECSRGFKLFLKDLGSSKEPDRCF